MGYGLVLAVHIVVCMVLVSVILLQGGRGGLSESLGGAAAQSIFGGGVKTVLTRATAVCAGIFVVTCLSLAYLSTVKGRSVIEQVPLPAPGSLPVLPGVLPTPATDVGAPEEAPSAPAQSENAPPRATGESSNAAQGAEQAPAPNAAPSSL